MKSVMKLTAGLIVVLLILVPPLAWLDYGWPAAVVIPGTLVACVLVVGIWSTIVEARHRRRP